MDAASIKTIEAHLASQVREQISELVRNMSPIVNPSNAEQVDASRMVDAETHEKQHMQEDCELTEERKPLQALTHLTADIVVIENSQSRLYEKFVRDGSELHADELKSNEDQLFEILDEVDEGVIKTPTSQSQTQNIPLPYPVVNMEFDESMLFDAIEDEAGDDDASNEDTSEAEEYDDDEDSNEFQSDEE